MPAISVTYCSNCSMPPEYCFYNSGNVFAKCKDWLSENHADLFTKLHQGIEITDNSSKNDQSEKSSATIIEKGVSDISITESVTTDQQQQQTVKEEQKQQPSSKPNRKEKLKQIKIKTNRRNKRKYTTHIMGMELFEIDLKKAAKLFAGKFACGSGVSKNGAGVDEIVIQGDPQQQLIDLIVDTWKIDKDCIVVEQA